MDDDQRTQPMTTGGFKLRGLRWWIISLIFLATLINYIDRLTISVLAPVITRDLGLTNTEFGGIITWFLLAYTISQGLSGKLYDRVGTKRGFVCSITLWSIAAMAHAFARGLASLSVFRFVLGFGEAGNWPGAAKTVAEWFPIRERAFGMAIFNSGAAIGSVVAPPLIVWLSLAYGWQTTFIATGALGFAWLILWLLFYQTPDRHKWLSEDERRLIREGQRGDGGSDTDGENCCAIDRCGRLSCRGSSLIRCGGSTSVGCRSILPMRVVSLWSRLVSSPGCLMSLPTPAVSLVVGCRVT
jgi:ACS family hexuronate transporter-like MFS transporter